MAILHLAGCLYYFPPGEIFSGEPLLSSDYSFHFLAGRRLADLVREGSFWGYSTTWAAGFPDGFLAMVNSKPWTLVLAASPSEAQPLAFNLAVLFALWAFPPLVYAAARELGHDRAEATVAMALAAAAWYGSALFRIFWRGGSVLFVVASGLALWMVARLHRDWSRPEENARSGLLHLAAAALPWIHPVAPLTVAIGGAAVWATTLRRGGLRLGRIATLAAATVLPSLPWLIPFATTGDLRRGFEYGTLEGAPGYLMHDLFAGALHLAAWHRGEVAILCPLAIAALVAAPVLRRRGPLLPVMAIAAAGLAFLAYGGARALGGGVLQPHRFAMPLAALAAIAAAPAFLPRRRPAVLHAILLLLAALLVADRLRIGAKATDYLASGLAESDEAALALLRKHAADEHGRIASRVVLEGVWLSEPVPGRPSARHVSYAFVALERRLDAEWIGASLMTAGLWQEHASFWMGTLFGKATAETGKDALLADCERYDVGWIVAATEATRAWLGGFAPEITLVEARDPIALFRVARAPARATHGTARSDDGRAILYDSPDGEPATLRYHWLPGMIVEPAAEIRPVAADPSAPVSFVEIDPPSAGSYRISLAPREP